MDLSDVAYRRTLSYDDARTFLSNMAMDLIGIPYSCVSQCIFSDTSDYSSISYKMSDKPRTQPIMKCLISLKELVDRKSFDGYVFDVDVLRVGKHIAHEARHL